MVIYDSADIYINGATCLRDKIARIDAIIVALEDAALKGAAQGNISDYSLNDGQTQIRTAYRSITDISASINAFEQIRQRYINQLNGRVVRLVDSKNFRRNGI